MKLKDIQSPNPHYIPGYTGYCPQYSYRVGDTYGSVTHKLLIDPCVPHAEKLIVSDKNSDTYQVERPKLCEIDIVGQHSEENGDPIYKHPMIAGYEGFIPRIHGKYGQRFSVAATEALSDFQKYLLRKRCKEHQLKHRGALQLPPGSNGRSLGERLLTINDYKLPLKCVRPECQGIIRDVPPESLPSVAPIPYSGIRSSPYFMENDNPEKYHKLGHNGHQPFTWPRFGQSNQQLTNSSLCDFTNNYQHRRSTEWAPITNASITNSPATNGLPNSIYHKNIGLIPNYGGHVPGATFRFGSTYGKDSTDAKRWLRGDFTV